AGLEPVADRRVAVLARGVVGPGEDARLDAGPPRALERERVGLVGGDGDDLRLVAVDRLQQRLEVGARPGGEHADAKRRVHAARRGAEGAAGRGAAAWPGRGGAAAGCGGAASAPIRAAATATAPAAVTTSWGNGPLVVRSAPSAISASTRAR